MAGIGTSGFGPGSSFRFSGQRAGSLDGRNNSFRYPSAWWDIAQMELPRSVKHLFKWCLYHAVGNPLVKAVVDKMSAYPITEIVLDTEPVEGFDRSAEKWKDFLFRVADVTKFQKEIGLDYHTYGNCIISISFPFHKYLKCKNPRCSFKKQIKRLKFLEDWDFRDFKYILKCPDCGFEGECSAQDHYYLSYKDIKLIRWPPQDIDIDFNPITRKSEYTYNPPEKVRTAVLTKKRSYLEELPAQMVESLKFRRPFVLNQEYIFHFKAPTPSLNASDEGWGYPPILPALKDSFYLQIMKKAQEAIMMEQLIPLDVIFPAGSDAEGNPYINVNLANWKSTMEGEIVKWRWDPNYKPILPIPIGYQRIGGNGRALMLTQEIRAWSEHMIAGMGVPQEFVFGGMSWSGSSVSLRMLENQFIDYRRMHEHFLQHFLIPKIARYMGWKEVGVRMKTFKMADDMPIKQLLITLNQMHKISDKSLLEEFNFDAADEAKLVEEEIQRNATIARLDAIFTAQIQAEQQKVLAKAQEEIQERMSAAQAKAQAQMGGAQDPTAQAASAAAQAEVASQEGSDPNAKASEWASQLRGMEPVTRDQVLQQMKAQMPTMADLVAKNLEAPDPAAMQPLPEQKPPRRKAASI